MQTNPYHAGAYPLRPRAAQGARLNATQHWANELHRWEFVLLQGAVFFAPYISFRHPAIFITIGDILFAGAFLLRLANGRLAAPFASLTWLWLLGLLMLTAGLFIGSAFHGDLVRCLVLVAQYCFAYLLVPLVLLNRSEEEVIRLIKCGIAGMTLMCAIGAVLYWSGYVSSGRGQMALITGNGRLAGFVDNPNAMGVMTVMVMPCIWFLLLSKQMRAWVAFLCLGLLVIAVILTSSNTALFSMIAAALVFFGGRRNFKTLLALAFLGTAVLTFGQNYLPATFQDRVLPALVSGDLSSAGTFEDRQELNREALHMADENLIIGLGADQYRLVSRYGAPVHNVYLLLLNEGGGLSLLGFLVMLSVPILVAITANPLPHGKLVLLTTVTTLMVFANAVMGVAHVYNRAWFLFVFLAVSPALRVQILSPNVLPFFGRPRSARGPAPLIKA